MFYINKHSLATRFGKSRNSYEDATPVQEKMAQSLMKEVTARLAGKKVLSILELGCGTGRLTRQLIAAFPKAKITAIDISADMVAHSKAANPQANYIEADAEKYVHLLTDKFDLIISNATIQWFEKPEVTMKKLCEILTDDGHIAMTTFANLTFHELAKAFDNAYAFNGLERQAHTVPMRSLKQWQEIVPNAEIYDEIFEKIFPDVRSFLRSIQKAGAANSLANQRIIPRAVLKNMNEYYLKNFSVTKTEEIFATYHACYIFYQHHQ